MSQSLFNLSASIPDDKQSLTKAILAVTTATVSIILWLLVKGRKKSINGVSPLPPGPRGLPILGYLPFLGPDLHKEFTKLDQQYGPIFKLRLGSKLCVVISSPSLVKEIVRDQDVTFANRDVSITAKVMTQGGNDIAFGDYGPEWKNRRKIFVREMMSNGSLDASYELRRRSVRKAIQEVSGKIEEPVHVGELVFRTNMSNIMSMVWGAMLEGEHGEKVGTQFKKLMAEMMVLLGKPNISDLFPMLAKFDLQGLERRSKELLVVFEKFLDEAIERSYQALIESRKDVKGEGNGSKDFLTLLLELKDREDTATPISMTQIKAMLIDIVSGRSDTTSTIIEWTMAELLRHPEAMERVSKELEQVVGLDNEVEQSHLPKLNYLEAVVKEAFRLHPALPFLVPRRPTKTTTVGGYTIPENSAIFLNVYSIHRNPAFWENPLEFRPERFLSSGEKTSKIDFSGNNFEYLPFGSGRRVCPGLPLAERMLIYQLASLLHSFEWKLPAGSKVDMSDKFGIVVKKTEPLIAIPTPRLANSDLYLK